MKLKTMTSRTLALLACSALISCGTSGEDINLVQGPAIIDVVTPFDSALACLKGKVDPRLTFAVGNVPDATGREAYNEGGAGKFVTQSGGDMVQSALYKTGVKVINRRDVGSTALEAQWGIRSLDSQQVANFAITGSINSLDFLPGAGAFVNVGGLGARYRQNRILVGLDLAMTNVATGQIVSNIALKKQIVADDAGIFGSGFSKNRLADVDVGGGRREALNDALRAMLQLATFELIVQLMPPQKYEECITTIDPRYGTIAGKNTAGEQYAAYRDAKTNAENSQPQAISAQPLNAKAVPSSLKPANNPVTDSIPGDTKKLTPSTPPQENSRSNEYKRDPAIPPNR